MSGRAAHLEELGRVEANRDVLAILATMSGPRTSRSSSPWDIDEFVLHSHPDLSERLEEVGRGLPGGGRYFGVYGHAVLLDPGLAIRVVAMGNAGFAIRVGDAGVRADIATWSRFAWDRFGPEWVGADPWPAGLPTDAGTERVRSWLQAAFAEPVGATSHDASTAP
jgi:hypothetical protein